MEKMTYEARSKRYLARGDISPEKLAQRLGEYENTGLEPQEIKELQLRSEAAQDALGDSKMYAEAFKDKADELEDKHWEECRQIALYDDELRRTKELLENRECYIRDLEHELGYDTRIEEAPVNNVKTDNI